MIDEAREEMLKISERRNSEGSYMTAEIRNQLEQNCFTWWRMKREQCRGDKNTVDGRTDLGSEMEIAS